MAENRGGYRLPKDKGAKAPGVGKNSKRTDAQPIRAPHVQEGTDLAIGDRKRLEAGMRSAPLKRASSPTTRQAQVSPALGASGMEELPAHLFSMPSTRPDEDVMVAPEGVPDADDDREFILQVLASGPWGNQRVKGLLDDLRKERVAAAQIPAESPLQPAPIPEPLEPELGAEPMQPQAPEEESFF